MQQCKVLFISPPSANVQEQALMRRQVEVLKDAGVDAGFFAEASGDIVTQPSVVVFPQSAVELAARFSDAHRVFLIHDPRKFFRGLGWEMGQYPQQQALALLVTSADALECVKHAFPEVEAFLIGMRVDTEAYCEGKKIHACYLASEEAQARQLHHYLRARGVTLPFTPVVGGAQSNTLHESRFFLSFGGNAEAVAQAMGCGCIVVGYTCLGAGDYLRVPYAYPIEHGDIVAFAATLEALLGEDLDGQSKLAHAFIRGEFSADTERESILSAWNKILIP